MSEQDPPKVVLPPMNAEPEQQQQQQQQPLPHPDPLHAHAMSASHSHGHSSSLSANHSAGHSRHPSHGGQTPSGQAPSGHTPSGHTPSGHTPSGQTTSGQASSGHTPSGHTVPPVAEHSAASASAASNTPVSHGMRPPSGSGQSVSISSLNNPEGPANDLKGLSQGMPSPQGMPQGMPLPQGIPQGMPLAGPMGGPMGMPLPHGMPHSLPPMHGMPHPHMPQPPISVPAPLPQIPVGIVGAPQEGFQQPDEKMESFRPLNVRDALQYLETVKRHFSHDFSIYTRFLDIMKDFKSRNIDTPGVIEGVSTLFAGHPSLIQGFNAFLPIGYNIECNDDPEDHSIRVTTPLGTTTVINTDDMKDKLNQMQPPQPQPPQVAQAPQAPQAAQTLQAPQAPQVVQAPQQTWEQQEEAQKTPQEVEFSHAINYVNKIKTRFANQPGVYKEFLEILQTYQKEQQSIQEVYAKVTVLFRGAPDLLADFKQFLPDTSAAAQTVYVPQQYEPAFPARETHLPPLGNFSPPTKEERAAPAEIPVSSVRSTVERKKKEKKKEEEPVGPALLPGIPEPVAPQSKQESLVEETNFFDKVKKALANKQVYNEFLKVLNLYSQDLLDKATLVERVEHYLGPFEDLFSFFKEFVGYDEVPLRIENVVYQKHKLDLDLCESYGPSYKRLPKVDTYMPCSGRDEMCWEVLNDEWVGHPVWASEDSGFIAHRKNQYEETMFKTEEERHEYDFYIEANLRTIQTLETIANKIANMSNEEKAQFKLPPGLGHTSLTIYKKVIRKVYDKDRGFEIIDALHENPAIAVPIVLKRLKQKDEEWRRAQREWNKVWRELEQKVFYKSLDHLGLSFKQADKKLMTTKQLISEIEAIKVEQNHKRSNPMAPKPQKQLDYDITDMDVLYDIVKLCKNFLDVASTYSSNDKERLYEFFKSFLVLFFGNNKESVMLALGQRLSADSDLEKTEREVVDETSVESSPAPVSKRPREGDLLKDVLKKSKMAPRDEEAPEADTEAAEEACTPWISMEDQQQTQAQGVIKDRHVFNMFCNTGIYVFFRHLVTLYLRLQEVKKMNDEITKEIKSRHVVTFAKDLNLVPTQLTDMGLDFKDCDDAYTEVLRLSRRLIEGDLENQWFEESLRQAFRNRAFKLFTIDKMVQSLVKNAHNILSDARASEIMMLFENDRRLTTTSVREQLVYRLQVRSNMSPTEHMFRIEFDNRIKHVCIQFVDLDDLTIPDLKTSEEKYNYYVTSYVLSHPTEGVPLDDMVQPFLASIVERQEEEFDEEDDKTSPEGIVGSNLQVKVGRDDYKLTVQPGSFETFTRNTLFKYPPAKKESKFSEFWEGPTGWKRNLSEQETEAQQATHNLFESTGKVEVPAPEPKTNPQLSGLQEEGDSTLPQDDTHNDTVEAKDV